MAIKMPKGKNTAQLQLENRSTLLKLLHRNDHICRKDLAEMSGLTGAAVTNLVRDMIAVELIKEDRDFESSLNRNAIPLQINYQHFLGIGVNLRRDRLSYALFNLNGQLLEKKQTLLQLEGPIDNVLQSIKEAIDYCICVSSGKGRVVGIGVSTPGPIHLGKGEISFLTHYPEWKAIPIKKYLKQQFSLPVILDNNSNAVALAEKWFGEGKEYQHMISFLISKGIGAGIILDGKIFHGAFGFAGEVGHMSINYDGPLCDCGNRGCLELYCSTDALLKKAQTDYDIQVGSWDEFKNRVKNGDQTLAKLAFDSGRHLGYGIVNLVNTYNPELIVLNGDMNDFGIDWLETVKQAATERLLPDAASRLQIKFTSLQENPVLLGTLAMVSEFVFEQPELSLFMDKPVIM
ncbi:MAG TPA: hypothetical protein DDW50_12265 [Firmicutes bacterium]|nr:hypothetical protein [Bacillota bacterium]